MSTLIAQLQQQATSSVARTQVYEIHCAQLVSNVHWQALTQCQVQQQQLVLVLLHLPQLPLCCRLPLRPLFFDH
jgi:hypothetical protein